MKGRGNMKTVKKTVKKTVSVVLTASMLMTLGACQDKSMDEVIDLAEDVAKYTCDLDYKKLSKMTEDGDEDLEEIFDAVKENEFREAIASTLSYEVDEDSIEKDGKNGYTVDVTFTYVDYDEALDGETYFIDTDEFEDLLDDCDEVVEETITLEFEKDGSDILLTNIGDLEGLFPYSDEEYFFAVNTDSDVIEEVEEDDDDTDATVATTTEPSDTTPSTTSSSSSDSEYPDPADYYVDGVCVLLHDTNILFNIPQGYQIYGADEAGADDFVLIYGWNDNMTTRFYVTQGGEFSCYEDFVLDIRDSSVDSLAEYSYHYDSHVTNTLTMVVGDYQYDGVLATVTSTEGDETYIFVVMIGNEDYYYTISVETDDLDFIYDYMSCFGYVE